jgi:membrane protein YdbS with pleckstrin-like domain
MSEMKFECPHCKQHITCDTAFGGLEAQCPTCEQSLMVPPMAALISAPAIAPPLPQTVSATIADLPEEHPVFEITPTPKAFLGEIIVGILLSPLIIGIFMLVRTFIEIKCTRYGLTSERFFVQRGFFAKRLDEIELYRISDVAMNQSLIQRMLGFGNITVTANDDTSPIVFLVGIKNPIAIKETLRKAYRTARRNEGVRATEWVRS